MEEMNKIINSGEENVRTIKLSKSDEKIACYKGVHKSLIKLLCLIEEEGKYADAQMCDNTMDISLWFYGFVFELSSSNTLCDGSLTKILVKIHGLYEKDKYRTMTHAQIKRQIMDSVGIIKHLIEDEEKTSLNK